MQQLQNITLQKESILSDKKKRVYKSVSMFLLFLKNEMINQRMLQTRVFHLSIKAATAWLGKKLGGFGPRTRAIVLLCDTVFIFKKCVFILSDKMKTLTMV